MANQVRGRGLITTENVARYVTEKITTDGPLEAKLRAETMKLPQAGMISGPDAGAMLSILAKSIGAKKAIEVGTFTGYTALKVAQALPKDGKLVCCDISEEWTSLGRKYWKEAGVDSRIDLRIQPALDTLNALAKNEAGTYDFAFIDADKGNYEKYYEACLTLLRPNGVIVLDNVLWHGTVADPNDADEIATIMRNLNAKISRDSRVESCIATIGDGLMIVRKK